MGPKAVGVVGDDTVNTGIDQTIPVVGAIGRPSPDGQLALLGANDDVAVDAGVLDRDSLGIALQGRAEKLVERSAANGYRDDSGRNARLSLPRLPNDVPPKRLHAHPVPGAEPDDEVDDRLDQPGILLGIPGRRLEFAEDGKLTVDKFEHFFERRDVLAVSRIGFGELVEAEQAHFSGEVGGAIHRFVVHQHRDAVPAELDVDFDGLGAGIEAGFHPRERVGRRFAGTRRMPDHEWHSHDGKHTASSRRSQAAELAASAGVTTARNVRVCHDDWVSESYAGKLLVASPKLVDPNFQRTVVLVCSHDEKGTFGLVLNRPLEGAAVGEHVPAWMEHVAEPTLVFQGGPVEATVGLGLALSRDEDDRPGWTPVVGRLGLADLARPPGSEGSADIERARVLAGYSGWGAGQLEAEMADEAWFVVDADQEDAFTPDPGRLWHEVLRRQGGKLAMFAFFPEDPTVN